MNNEPHPENGGLNCIDSNKEQKNAQEEVVKSMEHGVTGSLGQVVEVIVKDQDPDAVIIQLLQMEDLIVLVRTRKTNIVVKEDEEKVLILNMLNLHFFI